MPDHSTVHCSENIGDCREEIIWESGSVIISKLEDRIFPKIDGACIICHGQSACVARLSRMSGGRLPPPCHTVTCAGAGAMDQNTQIITRHRYPDKV